jgi:hypothetical protein
MATTKRSNQRAARLAQGGKTPMFNKQAAGSARPGHTGKDQSVAPWPAYARGDENVRRGESARSGEAAGFARGGPSRREGGRARAAKPGRTGAR